jgi:hypothetical protein
MRRSCRRGVEVVEFAFIFPLFLILFFAMLEFSWYLYQRNGVVDAVRIACRYAAQLDPAIDDLEGEAAERLETELQIVGVDCTDVACFSLIEVFPESLPPRIVCSARVGFRALTGAFGQGGTSGAFSGVQVGGGKFDSSGLLPDSVNGTSVAMLENLQ